MTERERFSAAIAACCLAGAFLVIVCVVAVDYVARLG